MSRRRFCVAVCAAALLLACEPPRLRPNILFITIDTLRADHLGTYGYKRPTSPRLDEFAKSAIVFEQAHSSASWTLPSLPSVMTSLYSSTHGCFFFNDPATTEIYTLAELLRNDHYDTAMVASHTFLSGRYGLQKGFTHVDSQILQVDAIASITSPDITAKGVEWLREKAAVRDGVPWLLWLHYFDPHDTYLPHPGFSEKFGTKEEMDLYDGEIAFTDHYVGVLLDELAHLGLADDTIVVVVADHGEEFLDHGNMRHGNTLYEEVVRVPFMMRIPGYHPWRVEPVVASVDLMPTLLELTGTAIDYPIEGRSLVALLRGERDAPREAVSEVRWHDDQDMKSLRKDQWKYIDHRLGVQKLDLLFSIPIDPSEEQDVSAAEMEATNGLRAELSKRLARARDLAQAYGSSQISPSSAADAAHLKGLGYTGDEKTGDAPMSRGK
jgi:arylsulfatase A-like enzyme